MNDGYGVCDQCLWNGKLRKDGTLRKHRQRSTSYTTADPGERAQDMDAPVCGGSYEAPVAFGVIDGS